MAWEDAHNHKTYDECDKFCPQNPNYKRKEEKVMTWYEVRIGWEMSCGGEWEEFLVKAKSKEAAKKKVLANYGKVKKGDRIEADPLDDDQVFDNGVIRTGWEYWER